MHLFWFVQSQFSYCWTLRVPVSDQFGDNNCATLFILFVVRFENLTRESWLSSSYHSRHGNVGPGARLIPSTHTLVPSPGIMFGLGEFM